MDFVDAYELLDFGRGRKLERLGGILLDRTSPPAEGFAPQKAPSDWRQAEGVFWRTDGLKGKWSWRRSAPQKWIQKTPRFALELKPTDVGHLGIFPEQYPNWEWIYSQTKTFLQRRSAFRALNLFAYTGGSTLAVAAAMNEAGKTAEDADAFCTVHVDSAKNIVQWARNNAEISGLQNAPVRWIAEDALKFVQREVKRDRKYEAIILDPPTYGHGTKGEVWKLERCLPELLRDCAKLMDRQPAFVLLTAHSPGLDAKKLGRILEDYFPQKGICETYPMFLKAKTGKILPSGEAARIVWRD